MVLTLIALAAGLSTRYGALKQLEAVGPSGETLLDYGVYDAIRAGFTKLVLVIRPELEAAFRERYGQLFGARLSVAFAFQRIEALPEGYTVPERRRKPWGTGHAVLTARSLVTGPFVVMNADDFYGYSAYERLGEHLRIQANREQGEFAAAGYQLRDTLSSIGGVSRAVCELDAHGYLRRVTEVKEIKERGGELTGVTVAGEPYRLTGDETISMNLWAATPNAFPLLEREFARFIRERGEDPDAEFLLSTAVNDLIAEGDLRVKVLPAPGPWLGVTHPEDRGHVTAELRRLVDEERYPADLFADLGLGAG